FAVGEGFVPAGLRRFVERGGDIRLVNLVHGGAMHANDVEEGFAIDVPAGTSGAGHHVLPEIGFGQRALRRFGGGNQRLAEFGDARGLQVGLTAHDGGDAGGVVTASIGVIRQAGGHEQRAEVGIAESERAIIVRVPGDHLGWIAGVVDKNFLGGNDDVNCVTIGFDVEGAVGSELEQVKAGKVAGRVIEEHVLAARIAGVDAIGVLRGVPAVDGGIELHAGITAAPRGVGNFEKLILGLESANYAAVFNGASREIGIAQDRVHKVVGDANGVIGVLEENGRVSVGVRVRAVISLSDKRMRLGLFLRLTLDELDDIGVVYVEDDHLSGATSLASGLNHTGEGVESLHEAERTAGTAATTETFGGRAQRGEISAGTRSPLEQHAFGLSEGKDRIERILYRVDETGGALGMAISGSGEFDAAADGIPVPVSGIGVGLDAIATDVEPDGRIESRILADQDMHQFIMKDGAVVGSAEIALGESPVANGFGDAGNELTNPGLAFRRAERTVEILAGHDIGGGHGPVFGDLNIFLLEDHVALGVSDRGGALFPFDLVVGVHAGLGEQAAEGEARNLLPGCGGRARVGARRHRSGRLIYFCFFAHFG